MQSKPTTEQDEIPWLIKIQQESWQAEIILSGLIIFTLTKAPTFVSKLFYILSSRYIAFSDLTPFETLIKTGVYWLIAGFVVHLILRGIWAGFVGLSYTFPYGIIKENTNFAPKFQRVIDKIPTPEQSIITLEKYCSSLFSIAFMLFMILLGLSVFNLIFNYLSFRALIALGIDNKMVLMVLNIIVSGFVILYAIDFLTVGLIKKIKWLAPIYYPAYWFFNLTTLSFLYRNIYYTIATNFSRTKVMFAILLFITASSLLFMFLAFGSLKLTYFDYRTDSFMRNGNYENLRNEDQFIRTASIQSEIIDEGVIKLFVVYKLHIDGHLDDCITEKEFESLDKKSLRDKKLACLSDFYKVKIDGAELNNLSWNYYVHPKTKEHGIITWIDISALKKGQHEINITFKNLPEYYSDNWLYAHIPFYKSN